jgi:hypothetical protein
MTLKVVNVLRRFRRAYKSNSVPMTLEGFVKAGSEEYKKRTGATDLFFTVDDAAFWLSGFVRLVKHRAAMKFSESGRANYLAFPEAFNEVVRELNLDI